jgi:hypothetical protein
VNWVSALKFEIEKKHLKATVGVCVRDSLFFGVIRKSGKTGGNFGGNINRSKLVKF